MGLFREIAEGLAALVAAFLPARLWPGLPSLPIRRVAWISALLTVVAGGLIGVAGFLDYSHRVSRATGKMLLEAAEGQLAGRLPDDPAINTAPLGIALLTPIAFVFTPVGLLAAYLTLSGSARALTCVVDDHMGDPVLTAFDALVLRTSGTARRAHARRERERAEGPEVPDRLYPADWARVTDADFVIVASRRKPDWDKGTFVITSDKWYVVGEPFELRLADGLRTIYPIAEHTTTGDVMRRGVRYELPPLRTRSAPK